MYVQDFVIPFSREVLLETSAANHLLIKDEYSIEEIQERLEAATSSLREEGFDFISDHFSTYFWLLQKFKQCPQLVRAKGWKTLKKSLNVLYKNLQVLFDDPTNIDFEIQNKMCNITKMIIYLLTEMMKLYQDLFVEQNEGVLDGKSKKKQTKVINEDWDWNEEKHSVLIEIHSFLQLPIKMLWEPPVVDEEFINLIANICYKCLEDKGIGSGSNKYLRETIFQILGILIKNHLHGLSFCVKIVQLLKMYDYLVNPLAQSIVHLVKECNCSNIVKEIVREIAETDGDQLAADSTGTRSLNLFLVQLAESIPETIIPAIDLLIAHLSSDSYNMRICVVGVLGEIVLTVLTKENLDDNLKKMRDDYLDFLEEHIHDVNAFVRTKVLQIWQKLCLGKAIPVSRVNQLLELVIGRLYDKSTNVKKQSVHLIKDMLERNPFCGQLNISEIEAQLKEERKKLKLLEKEVNISEKAPDWDEIKPKLEELLKENSCGSESSDSSKSTEEAIEAVSEYIVRGEYKKAVVTIKKLQNEFCEMYNMDEKNCSLESLLDIMQKIYKRNEKPALVDASPEVQDKVEKHNKTIEYLENALKFSQLIDRALPIILTFLDSNVVTDVLEAMHFFTAAYLFGFKKASEGIKKMLDLVFSKESNVREAVSSAYKELYFQADGNKRQQSLATVRNLSDLILTLDHNQLEALQEVVREWVKADLIDKNCIQVMFEKFSMKLVGTTLDQCWAALVLIRMVGAEEPQIIKNNLSVLLNEGFRNHGSKNFLIARETCRALRFLLPKKEQGKSFDHSLRYTEDHEVFKILYHLLKTGIWKTKDPYYIPMADEAINLVFSICSRPDDFAKNLIVDLHESIVSGKRPVERKVNGGNVLNCRNNDDLLLSDDEDKEKELKNEKEEEKEDETENQNELLIHLLTRFISILGQVASNYILYLEGPILDELKLRNQLDFERKIKKFEENKKLNVSMRRRGKANESRADKNLNETGAEDLEFCRVAADDMDAEEMRKKTENTIVTGKGFLAKYAPLILTICKNPKKYNNKPLQNAALLSLSKFMQVSSIFCEENLQLLVTICEKSQNPERQENAIIALGALQYRFPNSLEPWTPHMYAMLQHANPSVRYSSILILTDLIVNEMIKVRSHISNLAICIVDKEVKIARVARHFFREYSQNGNSLNNVLPNLIANLTQTNSTLSSKDFKTIMTFILGLITKEKQSEYLVEKLCQHFESATTERQWGDLAFCLSLLHYSDKNLKKILENMRFFAHKLYVTEVYEAIASIVSEAGKNPQRDKTLVNEISAVLKEYKDKSGENKSLCALKKIYPASNKKKMPRRKYLPSDSEEDEDERRTRGCQQKRKSNGKDSGEEEEDEDASLSDGVSKRLRGKSGREKRNANKENCRSSDDESDDSVKRPRKITRSKTSWNKKTKAHNQTLESSSDDDKEETKKKSLRSGRTRK